MERESSDQEVHPSEPATVFKCLSCGTEHFTFLFYWACLTSHQKDS